jgi:hypothetical protein
MPIHLVWDDEALSIVRWDVDGAWSWEDVYNATLKGAEMARNRPHRVDFIINLQKSGPIPMGSPLSQTRSLTRYAPPNWGVTVYTPMNAFVRALHGVFVKVYPDVGSRQLVAVSLEQARQLIADSRAKHSEFKS